jgi:hypothetical protein
MGATGAEREAEAGMMKGDILDETVMVKMVIDHREATSIEAPLVADHAPSRQVTTATTDQGQMDDLDVTIQSEMMTELEIGVIDQWNGDVRQVRRSVPKAKLRNHNLLKTNVIGGRSLFSSLPHGLELKS